MDQNTTIYVRSYHYADARTFDKKHGKISITTCICNFSSILGPKSRQKRTPEKDIPKSIKKRDPRALRGYLQSIQRCLQSGFVSSPGGKQSYGTEMSQI